MWIPENYHCSKEDVDILRGFGLPNFETQQRHPQGALATTSGVEHSVAIARRQQCLKSRAEANHESGGGRGLGAAIPNHLKWKIIINQWILG
jgi:hypothetical protein